MPTDPWAGWLDGVEREASRNRWATLLRCQARDRVLAQAGLRPGAVVVDLGCGLGLLSLEAARLVGPEGRVYAVDADREALEELRVKVEEAGLANVSPVYAEITNLPLPAGEADAVVARSVFSYLEDRSKVLKECFRVLRPGGRLSVCEPLLVEEELLVNWDLELPLWEKATAILRDNHPAYSFRRSDLVREVREAGFTRVDFFVWYADVTRPFRDAEEAWKELEEALPGRLSPLERLLEGGMREEEIERLVRRWAEESRRFSYRDILPCCFVWGEKPLGPEGAAKNEIRSDAAESWDPGMR
ncbi:class I SAM-dependent methyltransferase [Candidatus Solincola sp.]|nr:methyltransferase domain-containing protein [Actinomycetota bacterium]